MNATNTLKIFEKSIRVGGCGDASFASLAAYREHGQWIRAQQAAIVARRAALAGGEDAEDVAFLLSDDLAHLGMDAETIQEHVDDPQKDVDGLFIDGSDLAEVE